MRIDKKEIITYARKVLIFSSRTSYRSACDHPFAMALVFFLLVLYRFLPSLFGFLVSSSPVIICTALLLGTLLSFGQPNIPEIEEEEKTTHGTSSLRVGAAADDLVVKKDESFSIESHVENRGEIEETVVKAHSSEQGDVVSKADREMLFSTAHEEEDREDKAIIVGTSSPSEEDKKEIHSEKKVAEEREVHDRKCFEKEFNEEKVVEGALEMGEYVCLATSGPKDTNGFKVEIHKPSVESCFDSSLDSSWKLIRSHDASSDSGSDGAESSSPDASMADIIPMLDELHPLLDSEPPQPVHISVDELDTASDVSSQDQESDDGSVEEVAENKEGQEEEAQEEKDDGAAVAVTWTADDEKNLMDLGTSELERNQRLENLIAKRRARTNLRAQAEKNLIDLDSNNPVSIMDELSRLLVQIPPVSTTKRNPFDLPYDSEESTPPIPGSAPSVLLPSRNPFDRPFDQVHGSGSLTGESTRQQESVAVPQKEMFFRRHESFALGSSFSGEHKPEKRDIKLRPYFVTERMDLEMSYSQFQRQLSEKSDSKMSSVPESESISSVADPEYHKELFEKDLRQESEFVHDHRDSKMSSVPESGSISSAADPEYHKELFEKDLHQESEFELISPSNHDAKPVEQESQSSEDVDSVEIVHDHREINIGSNHEFDFNPSKVIEEDTHEVADAFQAVEEETRHEMDLASPISDSAKVEVVEEKYNESTSSSSVANEKNFNMNIDEGSTSMEQPRGDTSKGSRDSVQSVIAESDLLSRAGEVVDDSHVVGPVYDSSPSAIVNSLSNIASLEEALLYGGEGSFNSTSSLASDMQVETSEMGSPPRPVEKSIFTEVGYSTSGNGSMGEEPVSGNGVLWVASSNLSSVEENESRSREANEIRENDVIRVGFSEFHGEYNDPIAPVMEESAHYSSSYSIQTDLSEDIIMDEGGSLRSDGVANIDTAASHTDGPVVSDYLTSHASEKAWLSIEKSAVQASYDACLEESQGIILPSIPEEIIEDFKHEEENESMATPVINVGLTGLRIIEEPNVSLSDLEQELSLLQKKSTEQTDGDGSIRKQAHVRENGDSLVISPVASVPDSSFTGLRILEPINSMELSYLSETKAEIPGIVSSTYHTDSKEVQSKLEDSFPEHLNGLEESDEVHAEVEEIKGIDEGLLSELDAVGDFHVVELRLNKSRTEQQCEDDFHFSDVGVDSLIHSEVQESFSPLKVSEARSIADIKISPSEGDFDNSGGMLCLEAKSHEDINSAFKQLTEGSLHRSDFLESVGKEPVHVESDVGPSEVSLNETPLELLELQQVEARSLEDVHMALKHVSEGTVENPPELVEPEDESNPQQVEARSLEDIHMALKHVSEGTIENPPKPMEPKDSSSEVEAAERHRQPNVLEVQTTEETELASKAAIARDTGTSDALGVEQSSDVIEEMAHSSRSTTSASRKSKKKEKSRKSSSSPSSSASSSSSDTD